jgi:hypothetical protein
MMPKSGHREEQIVAVLRQVEGRPVASRFSLKSHPTLQTVLRHAQGCLFL